MYIFFVRKIKETKEWKKIEDQRRWERGNEKEEMRKKDKEKQKQKWKQKKKERERDKDRDRDRDRSGNDEVQKRTSNAFFRLFK